MKLYSSAFAPNPRRVLWAVYEKRAFDIERVEVDLIQGAHKTAEFVALTGRARLPVLELDDGTCLGESLAIARHLESLYPEPNLFGRDPLETAQIEVWTRRAELELATPLMLAVRHLSPYLAALETQKPEIGAHERDRAVSFLPELDARLAGRDFIAAERLTIADIVAYTGLDFARLIKLKPSGFENIVAWQARLRPRAEAAFAGLTA